MKKTTKLIIKSVSLMTLFVLLPFLNAQAAEINNLINQYDNIQKYYALENKSSFPNLPNNTDSLKKELPRGNGPSSDITKELQDITLKQDFSIMQIDNAISILKNRNGIKTFFLGNKLGTLKFQLVQIKNQIHLLDALALKSQDSINTIQINNQAASLRKEQAKVESFVLEQDNKFSLFGWFVNSL